MAQFSGVVFWVNNFGGFASAAGTLQAMLVPIPLVRAVVAKDNLTVTSSIEMATLVPMGIHHPRCLAALVRSDSTVSKSDGETGETKRSESHFDGWRAGSKSGC